MLYMDLLPQARPEYQGSTITGQVARGPRSGHTGQGVGREVRERGDVLVQRISASEPAIRVTRVSERRFRHISSADCPEREEEQQPPTATTDRFYTVPLTGRVLG